MSARVPPRLALALAWACGPSTPELVRGESALGVPKSYVIPVEPIEVLSAEVVQDPEGWSPLTATLDLTLSRPL